MSDQQQPSPADTAMCGRCGHVAFWHANFGRGNCQVIAGCDCHEFKMSAQPSPARVKQLENAVDAADRVMAGHIEATLPAAAWRAWRREHRDALCEAQPSPAVPPEGEDDERLKVIRGTIDRLASANTDVSRQYIADVSFLMGRLAQTRLQHAEQIAEKDKEIAILKLAVPLEEELSAKIDEMHKYLSMGQGFTLNGIGQLLDRCQRRMAADWVEIGSERRQRQQAESSLVQARQEIVNTKAENAALREENAALKQKQG